MLTEPERQQGTSHAPGRCERPSTLPHRRARRQNPGPATPPPATSTRPVDTVRVAVTDVLEPIVWAAHLLTSPAPASWRGTLAAAATLSGLTHGRI